MMKRSIFLLIILFLAGCSGGAKNNEVSERELYGKKRVDCKATKRTDEAANVIQCANIRPDAKEIKDTPNNLSEDYSPENYRPSNYQNILK